MIVYDGSGTAIEISEGGGSDVSFLGDTLTIGTEDKNIPAFNPQDLPTRSNVVHETAYANAGTETWFETGLTFNNPQKLTSFELTYTIEITGSATTFFAYMIGEDGSAVNGASHTYNGSPVTVTDTFTSATHLNSETVSLVFGFATANNTSATDRIATGRKVTIPTLPTGLELSGDYVRRTPALTKNLLTFDESKQYEKYNCRFTNKRYLALGDSITYGVAPYYVNIVGDMLGALSVTNGGIGGTSMVQLADTIFTKRFPAKDFVTIAHGVNDFDNTPNSPLGTLAAHGSTFDKSTYIGAAQYIIETIQTNSPNTEVILIAPIWNSAEGTTNTLGLTLNDYRNALKSVADSYGLVFINGYDIINASNANGLFSDGTHPNAKGQEVYGIGLAERLANS